MSPATMMALCVQPRHRGKNPWGCSNREASPATITAVQAGAHMHRESGEAEVAGLPSLR